MNLKSKIFIMSPGEMTWDGQSITIQHLLYVLERWQRRKGSYKGYCYKLKDLCKSWFGFGIKSHMSSKSLHWDRFGESSTFWSLSQQGFNKTSMGIRVGIGL